ncbi:MAG: hypothetical protein ACE5IJ_08470, partial [Thermoplasmata archaeon]
DVGAFTGQEYFEQMLSFDRDYSSFSPGMILSVSLVRELLNLRSSRIELGPGIDQRKKRLGGKPTDYSRVEGYLGWTNRIARLRRSWVRRFPLL